MTTTIEALFDGTVFRSDDLPGIPPNTRVRLIIESPPDPRTSPAEQDAARHESLNRMARMEFGAGTYDQVILPDGAEDE